MESYPKLTKDLKAMLDRTGTSQQAIAELVCDELFEFFQPKVFTEPEPGIHREYRVKSYEGRADFDRKYPNWRKDNGVEDWEKRKRSLELEMKSNLHWLKTWREILKGTPREQKLTELIDRYTEQEPPQVEMVRKIFNAPKIERADWDEKES